MPLLWLVPLLLAMMPAGTVLLEPVLLGLTLGVDAVNRPFLLLAGIAWPLAAWYARAAVTVRPARFWTWWNLSLAALTLTLLAQDLAGFYMGYAALTLAAFGQVVHDGTAEARRAGRVYLVLALAAESLVLYGVLTLAHAFGNASLVDLPALIADAELPAATAWLLLTGFAVKVGIVPLHVWLPLAHSIAPAPASAVLSGVIVKVGVLAWLRLVPPAAFGDGAPVTALILVGLASCFYGAVAGIGQSRIKTALAYSTVSQMGLLMVAFALVLHGQPATAVGLFVLHHGLNKAALFVGAGCGVGRSGPRMALMLLPAIALAGLPLTTGFIAKGGLKAGFHAADFDGGLLWLLTLTAAATTLLMARVLWLARRTDQPLRPIHPAWPLLVVAGATMPWAWAWFGDGVPDAAVLAALWPVAAAGIAYWAWLHRGRRGIAIPEGDLLAAFDRARTFRPPWPARSRRVRLAPLYDRLSVAVATRIKAGESRLLGLPGTGLVLLLVAAAVWLLL